MSVHRAKRTSGIYKAQPEWELQCAIADYLRRAYPSVRFLSDVRAATKLNVRQAARLKRVQAADFACPDLMIFAARRGYNGLFMELKAESPYRKDGALRVDEHLARQDDALTALQTEGYFSEFCWDFDKTRNLIDWYLSDE